MRMLIELVDYLLATCQNLALLPTACIHQPARTTAAATFANAEGVRAGRKM
jgi:hypothetical protein